MLRRNQELLSKISVFGDNVFKLFYQIEKREKNPFISLKKLITTEWTKIRVGFIL